MKEVRVYRDADGDLCYGDRSRCAMFDGERVRPEVVKLVAFERPVAFDEPVGSYGHVLVLTIRLK